VLVLLCAALLVALPPAGAATVDAGTTRPFGPPVGSCYTNPLPEAFAPNQLADAYGLQPLWSAGHQGQGVRVALLDPGELPDQAEVQKFRDCYGIEAPVHVHTIGTGAEPTVQGEATLDVEVVLTAAPKVDGVYVFTNRSGVQTPLVPLLEAALDPANTGGELVDAVSISFGGCETKEDADHPGYLTAMNDALQAAAARGVTVFVAGGDSGSAACATHPVEETNPAAGVAAVGFPGSSPWVVNVGGTQMTRTREPDGRGVIDAEVVWNEPSGKDPNARDAGGGGHSAFFAASSWQQAYGLPGTQRSTPDVTALAGTPGFPAGGDTGGWFGTSAASPFTAGGWATVLSALKADGLANPGFLAPILYELASTQYGDVYRDITIGSNDPWGKVGCCNAAPGYDNASGLGSIRFDGLAAALGAPTAALRSSPPSGPAVLTTTLDASGSTTPGGTFVAYSWDVNGDGTTEATTTTPTYTAVYPTTGTYSPRVTVTNSFGRTASASTNVAVGPADTTTPTVVPVAMAAPPAPAQAIRTVPRFSG
jgi:subtilase family serine protease